jgi:hypothetical protein
VHLVKRLGEVECRDCGAIVPPEDTAETDYAGVLDEEPGRAGLSGAGLSEEVSRALDRVLGQSLVSQSIQRAAEPEGKAGPGSGSVAGSGSSSGAGRHRPARAAAGDHAEAHPGAERQRAARPDVGGQSSGSLDEVRPGAFAG